MADHRQIGRKAPWVTARSSGGRPSSHRPSASKRSPITGPTPGRFLAGDLDDTDWAAPASATKVGRSGSSGQRLDTRWSAVVKSNASPAGRRARNPDIIPTGGDDSPGRLPGSFRAEPGRPVNAKTESALKTTIQQVPFVSVTGYPGPAAVVPESGIRAFPHRLLQHVQAVPASPDWVSDERAKDLRVILAAQVNATFDAARLARPWMTEANCLTATVSKPTVASIWRIGLRLYGRW